jgi:hypothetical protein
VPLHPTGRGHGRGHCSARRCECLGVTHLPMAERDGPSFGMP